MAESPSPAARAATRSLARDIVKAIERGESILSVLAAEPKASDAEALLARFALEIDLLFNDQIGFIEHAAMTARQTAVPVEVKQQLLREISEACRGRMPTWWPEMKAEIAEEAKRG